MLASFNGQFKSEVQLPVDKMKINQRSYHNLPKSVF